MTNRFSRVNQRLLGSAVVAALVAAGACGGADDAPAGSAAQDRSAQLTTQPQTANNQEQDMNAKPDVSLPQGDLPTTLVVTDLVTGTGAEATKGKTVSVHYVGVNTDGTEFDASWDRGSPLEFQIGAGMVIAGWDQGVAGMKVGGRRQLVIPPDLGYGSRGAPPVIKPNATLVFVVDLLSIR